MPWKSSLQPLPFARDAWINSIAHSPIVLFFVNRHYVDRSSFSFPFKENTSSARPPVDHMGLSSSSLPNRLSLPDTAAHNECQGGWHYEPQRVPNVEVMGRDTGSKPHKCAGVDGDGHLSLSLMWRTEIAGRLPSYDNRTGLGPQRLLVGSLHSSFSFLVWVAVTTLMDCLGHGADCTPHHSHSSFSSALWERGWWWFAPLCGRQRSIIFLAMVWDLIK